MSRANGPHSGAKLPVHGWRVKDSANRTPLTENKRKLNEPGQGVAESQAGRKSSGNITISIIAAMNSLSLPVRCGLRNSQTINPSGVTSRARPLSDSVISVLPPGSRSHDPQVLENRGWAGLSAKDQTTSWVKGSNSITFDRPACPWLSKISMWPLSSRVG